MRKSARPIVFDYYNHCRLHVSNGYQLPYFAH